MPVPRSFIAVVQLLTAAVLLYSDLSYVSLLAYLENHVPKLHSSSSACYMWPLLTPLLICYMFPVLWITSSHNGQALAAAVGHV